MNLSHPTREVLINAVVEMLKTEHLSEITREHVLARSGISKGSLYHHFVDFDDLLEEAEVRRFSNIVDTTIAWVAESLEEPDRESFIKKLESFNEYTHSENYRAQRLIRIKAVAHAGLTERMRSKLNEQQERLTGAIADMCQEMQFRGWVNPKFDSHTMSVFIQAYTLGQIVNDYVDHKVDPANWLDMVNTVLRKVILAQD